MPTAPLPTALVSNFHQFSDDSNRTANPRAMRFTTGSDSGGYTLSSIAIISEDPEGDSFSATLCPTDTNGFPPAAPADIASDSTCVALTAPMSFAAGILTFTAPANTNLAANTTYSVFLLKGAGVSTVHYDGTGSTSEDGSPAVWRIGDRYDFYHASGEWRVSSRSDQSGLPSVGREDPVDRRDPECARVERGYAQPGVLVGGHELHRLGGEHVSRITVTPTTSNASATVTYLDATDSVLTDADTASTDSFEVGLSSGSNVIKVKVTAADGTTTNTYTVTVTRGAASTDADLSALALSRGTLSPVFASADTSYTASVGDTVSRITVSATASDSNAAIAYLDGSDDALTDADTASTDSFEVDLLVGSNVIKVKVTAEDGTTTKTYTVTVTRPSVAQTNATGQPAISGQPIKGAVLTAGLGSIADPDGTTGATFTYTWLRCDSNGNNCDTEAGTGGTYTLVSADVGKRFRLRANFTDAAGNSESRRGFPWPSRSVDTIYDYSACGTPDFDNLSRGVVWTGTVTVGHRAVTTNIDYYGWLAGTPTTGSFSGSTSHTHGTETHNFEFIHVSTVVGTSRRLNTYHANAVSAAAFQSSADLQFHVCDKKTLNFSAATHIGVRFYWDVDFGFLEGTMRTLYITEPRISSTATLSALTLSAGTLDPVFSSDTVSYAAMVDSNVSSITVTPSTTHPRATVAYFDASDNALTDADTSSTDTFEVDLSSSGTNVVKVKVTAEDTTTTKTYTVLVTRGAASNNATLSALALSPGALSPAFSSTGTSYTASVAYAVPRITVSATASDAGATIAYLDGSDNALTDADTSSTDTFEVDLSSGSTVIKMKVTAADTTTTNIYTVTVMHEPASTDATLSALSLSSGTLAPTFSSAHTSYSASVGTTVRRITVSPTTNHANATVEFLAGSVGDAVLTDADTSSADTFEVDLWEGTNVIKVKVTAEDTTTANTYTVTVTRAAPVLSNLLVSTLGQPPKNGGNSL